MEHKKNCGCGQDPCVTYGAESFDAQTWNIKCDVCGEKPIYDTVDSEDYGKEIQVCEECFNGIFAAESNSANDDISLMMNLIDEIEANDIWNETINEMIRRGKAVRRPDGKVIFSDRVPQFDIIEDIAQYTTPEIKSAENSDHWMTFGRVDYNWVTDPEDLELTDENFYIIDAHIRDEVRYVIDNDNDNSSGESNLSSGDLNLTQEDEDEFTIYYYWGSPFTTGVNSAESEDDGPTNCGVCEVKIGYDEAIHYEELEWCEKCYEEQMERDMQNYTHDETDCISCGFAISPNDVRVELVEGLCPDCNYIRNAEDLSSFTSKELTESSAIHGDFDHASINYSGHQNLEVRAEAEIKIYSFKELSEEAQTKAVADYIEGWEETHEMGDMEYLDALSVLKYDYPMDGLDHYKKDGTFVTPEEAYGAEAAEVLDAEENIALADPSFWMNYPITSMLATAGIFAIGKTLLNSRKGDV